MREKLRRKFDRLEAMRERATAMVERVSPEKAAAAPEPGKWSAAQILHHVASAELGSLEYIRKKTQTPDTVPPAGLMCALRTFALEAALASPFRFKAPEVVANVPDNPPIDEVLSNWSRVRNDLREMIDTLPEDLLGRALFRHPAAG